MDNYYYLLIQTPQANASAAMQWLNVSYSVWFNRRHRRCGPLFQGRFKSIPVEAEGTRHDVSRVSKVIARMEQRLQWDRHLFDLAKKAGTIMSHVQA
jgi:hypothetical protein